MNKESSELVDKILKVLCEYEPVDCFTALTVVLVISGQTYKMRKPYLLNAISETWEETSRCTNR